MGRPAGRPHVRGGATAWSILRPKPPDVKGCKAVNLRHINMGHGPREEKHRLDVLNRMVGWFEKYLKK